MAKTKLIISIVVAALIGVTMAFAAIPNGTVDEVTANSIKIGSLKCDKDYRIRLWEKNTNGKYPKEYQQFIKTTKPCTTTSTTTTTTPTTSSTTTSSTTSTTASTSTTTTTTPPPPNCSTSVTPSTFAAAVSAAQPGDIICLQSGDYGTWSGTNKAIVVKGTSGSLMQFNFTTGDSGFTVDGVQGAGGTITNGANNITIKNSVFRDHLTIDGTATTANIVLDHNDHSTDSPQGAPNAMVGVFGGGVTILNSTFHDGDSDGVHIDAPNTVVTGNSFINLCDTGYNHTDNIQFQGGGVGTVISKNYVYAPAGCGTQGITSYDSGTHNMIIEDNVVDIRRPWGIELYSDDSSIVRHNTVVYYPDSGCDFTGIVCGQIDITSKTVDPAGQGTQVYDNLAIISVGRATVARNDHNVSGQGAIFVGPAPLNAWIEYYLAQNSVGKNAASDGLDVGIR